MTENKDRSLLPYGDSTLAPSFSSTEKEVSRWKNEKNKNSDDYFRTKADEIEKEYKKLKREFDMNEMIKNASLQFKPIVGESYYLYKRTVDAKGGLAGSTVLSIVSPQEYGDYYLKGLEFVGCFTVDSHDVWKKVEDA